MNLSGNVQYDQPARAWWSSHLNTALGSHLSDLHQSVSLEGGTVITNWGEAMKHFGEPITLSRMQLSPRQRFDELAAQWRKSVKHLSSTTAMAIHPAYQEIIGMGPAVVPYILDELSKEIDHWFWALRVITGVDPVPPSSQGRVRQMAETWLRWGRDQGYV